MNPMDARHTLNLTDPTLDARIDGLRKKLMPLLYSSREQAFMTMRGKTSLTDEEADALNGNGPPLPAVIAVTDDGQVVEEFHDSP